MKLLLTVLAAVLLAGVSMSAQAGVLAPPAGMRSAAFAPADAHVQQVYWVYRHHHRFWVEPRHHHHR